MTSRLLGLLQMLRRGGSASSTVQNPNAYAVIQLWKRFFESEQQQTEESISILEEVICGTLNSTLSNHDRGESVFRPIASQIAVQARRENVQEYYRKASSSSRVDHQLNQPNLFVPSQNGDTYLSLAQ
mmetsp:Transcript_18948/g.26932  ORF Transcript_18948/g.26932 Transcript_18948/m.26932 type:complete len:128 (-) Transcript_18948:121-504(-)